MPFHSPKFKFPIICQMSFYLNSIEKKMVVVEIHFLFENPYNPDHLYIKIIRPVGVCV